MTRWEKVLFRQQQFPDNYCGGKEQFLRELRKNVSVVQYQYYDAVVACCNLMFHVNTVILFYIFFEKVHNGYFIEEKLLTACFASLLVLYIVHTWFLVNGKVNFSDHVFTLITLVFYGFGLTPIIRTLTTTISSDTVYATSIFAAFISCVFHDYGVKAPIVSMPFSISSGLCSAIFLLSRLKSNLLAFTLLSSAFAIYACSPFFRNTLFFTSPLLASVSDSMSDYDPDYPPSKRSKAQHVNVDTPPEFFNISSTPSKVLHISDLPPKAQDPDLLEAFGRFGRVSYIVIKRQNKNMALLEFEAIDGASSVMCYLQTSPMYVCNNIVNVHFSALDRIPRFGFESDQPNRVLVIFVTNVQFNINSHTLYDICKPHGNVLRVAIVKRAPNITALVELETIEQARNCKHAINGADIYTNCCTLKVEYAKISNVVIRFPDEDHVDFTVPNPSDLPPSRRTLMSSPPNDRVSGYPPAPSSTRYDPDPRERFDSPGHDYRDPYLSRGPTPSDSRESSRDYGYRGYIEDRRDPYRDPRYDAPRYEPRDNSRYGGREARYDPRDAPRFDPRHAPRYDPRDDRDPRDYDRRDFRYDDRDGRRYDPRDRPNRGVSELMQGGPGCVLIVGGVDQAKLNCERLFNLLCLYGNVLRIMFMKKKTELALIEMGTHWQARDAVSSIKRVDFLGMRLEISLSNQNCVNIVREPFTLPDGSLSFMDFTDNKLNRYLNHDHADKNRPCSPQTSLHWFNAPLDINEEKIRQIFATHGAAEPSNITQHRVASGRSTAGTVEFSSIQDATEALVLANHAPLESSTSSTPFIIKLAYTKARGHRNTIPE